MGSRVIALIAANLLWAVLLTPSAGAAADGTVTSLAPMPQAISQADGATLSDGRVLVLGEYASGDPDALLYDPTTDIWSPTPPIATSYWGETMVPLPGDRALAVVGSEDATQPDQAEIFDGATNTWSAAAPMDVAVRDPAAVELPDGDVLITGGVGPGPDYALLTSTEIYDPSTDTWSTAAPMQEASFGFAVTEPGGTVLFLGDTDSPASIGDAARQTETYDPTTNTWTLGDPLPSSVDLISGAAPLPDGRVALVGWGNSLQATDMVYDPATEAITFGSSLPQYDGDPVVSPLTGGGVLIAGGSENQITTAPHGTSVGSSVATTSTMSWDPPAPDPSAELAPTISGSAIEYGTLTATSAYAGSARESFQLQSCLATCVDVGGPSTVFAVQGTPGYVGYLLTAADVGAELQVVVTVNGVSATSAPTAPVQASGDPASTLAPATSLPGLPLTPVASDIYSVATDAQPLLLGVTAPDMFVDRTDGSQPGSVQYRLSFPTANVDGAIPAVTGTLSFPAGITRIGVPVPSEVDGTAVPSGTVMLSLDDPTDGTLSGGPPVSYVVMTAPAVTAHDTADPLGLPTTTAADPLAGARFFVDRQSIAARVASLWKSSHPVDAPLLEQIAAQPDTTRFGAWDGTHPGHAVALFLSRAAAQEPGTIPLLSTYRIVDGQCHSGDDTVADAEAYATWIHSFAEGIGSHPAVLFLEMDSLITTPCLSQTGLAIRLGELRDAVSVLSNDPHLIVYLDAGAADALSANRAATLLKAAGVADTEGFYLNATHFDWTRTEIAYGKKISRMIGGKHFVVNTAENGQGPLIPKDRATEGNEVLCNPTGRGLGPDPTTRTGYADVDAFAWIANPGVSGGPCRPGAPGTGRFWPAMAVSLVKHGNPAVR